MQVSRGKRTKPVCDAQSLTSKLMPVKDPRLKSAGLLQHCSTSHHRCERDHRSNCSAPSFSRYGEEDLLPPRRFMGARLSQFLIVAILASGSGRPWFAAPTSPSSGTSQQTAAIAHLTIKIDYPPDGSIFLPEITPPTSSSGTIPSPAKRWVIQIFACNCLTADATRGSGRTRMRQVARCDPNAGPGLALTLSRHLPTPGSPTRKPGKRSSGSPPSQPRTSQS